MPVLLIALVAAAVAPSPAAVVDVTMISGVSPFDPDCGPSASIHAEVEVSAAVNPADPSNVIAAWQQDRILDGGARSNVVAVTKDGGDTWRTVVVPRLTECSGGHNQKATDPWLAFGRNGVAYLASLTYDGHGQESNLVVSRSTDGGSTWGDPIVVWSYPRIVFNDKETLTVDPYEPDNAYLVWVQIPEPAGIGAAVVTFFSRTTDGGLTWSPPTPIHVPTASRGGQGNEIAVLGDGSLLNVYTELMLAGGYRVMAMRSLDKGTTWLPPVPVASVPSADGPSDPTTGAPVRAGGWITSVESGPDGRVWVTWADESEIMLTSTTDGVVWPAAVAIAAGDKPKFTPVVAVRADGTVAVSYYDFRNDGSESALVTDVWLTTSTDGGATWTEQHLGGPFDHRRAAYSEGRGWFLGDYQGLVAAGSTFIALNAMIGAGPYSDVFAIRATA